VNGQENIARRLRVHGCGAHLGNVIDLLQEIGGHGLIGETVGRAGLEKNLVEAGIRNSHGKTFQKMDKSESLEHPADARLMV
jgi:hypothetical protein